VNPPPVEIGILLPTREAVMSSRFDTGPLLALAERIEAAGDDGGGDQAEQLERATRELLPRLKG